MIKYQYQYQVHSLPWIEEDRLRMLNDLGREGWQLAHFDKQNQRAVFMKVVSEAPGEEVKIGNLYIKPGLTDGKLWIENKEGEGMGISEDLFTKELDDVFNKFF